MLYISSITVINRNLTSLAASSLPCPAHPSISFSRLEFHAQTILSFSFYSVDSATHRHGPRIKNNLSPLTRTRIRKLPVSIVRNASTYRNLSFDRSTELTSYIDLWGERMAKLPVGRYSSCSNHSKFNVDDGSMIESRRKRKFSSRDDCFVLTKSRYITKGSIFRFKRFEEKKYSFRKFHSRLYVSQKEDNIDRISIRTNLVRQVKGFFEFEFRRVK